MSPEIEEKINGYLDESLSEAEMAELAAWIKADPTNAQQFAKAAMLHDRLHDELKAEASEAESKRKIIPFPIVGRWLSVAAAVIFLLIAVSQFGSSSDSFVTIARVEGTTLAVGKRLGAGMTKIETGMIRLLFDSGVEVTLEGPAKFQLVEADRMILSKGLLTANVPPGAEGFRVDTPTAQVTDLGTAFGVHLGEDGASHVSVFDGEVEVEASNSGTKQRLLEGEEVVVTPKQEIKAVNLDVTPYENVWPVSTGIKSSDGAFRLSPPWPRSLPLHTSDEYAFVTPDGYRMKLDRSLRVNASEPGSVAVPEDLSPTEIPAGTPLRSYILHYRPEILAPRRFPLRLSGSITFDRPISGVIVSSEEFLNSVGLFSGRKVGEKHPKRELELSGDSKGDRFSLSDDMRTLTVDLAGSRRAFDLIRVLVDASAPAG